MRPGAIRAVGGLSTIPPTIRTIVLDHINFWPHLSQLIRTAKPLVDAIGNVESRDSGLADCMLELIRCAQVMTRLDLNDDDDEGFWGHAKIVFNRRFHEMDTNYHGLALYLHPMCRRLAISQAANGRTFDQMELTAVTIAKKWKWNKAKAKALQADLAAYHRGEKPFDGGERDALTWWRNSRIDGQKHPLKVLAITLHTIVPHAAEIEKVFSGLGCTQSARRCRLNVETFEKLGKIRTNLHMHLQARNIEDGKPVHRKHAHMHTRTEIGSNIQLTEELERTFSWVPPLAATSAEEDPLQLPEEIPMEELDRAFKEFEDELERTAADARDNLPAGTAVLDGSVYSFDELDRVDKGVVPKPLEDDLNVVGDGDDDEWDVAEMISGLGV
ncbi:uncharacterized protein BXZ73DRAFT_57504 [Epithele typhae]|uniref:uncharacterized protein n=1 Tax=Epithele typhae TaxID=378194 RepID=UPI0020087E2E|nr:uncharacterized protein BXZ73DRAFT_57504 [Epithele typhae]KAH9910897.1 hypothetical protein BXZ73DRAFT_57504 [Epithele typhae]